MMFGGKVAKHLIEGVNVVRPVVGRQGNAGKQYLDARVFEHVEYSVEVAAGLIEREAAEAVVSAEFNDDDCGMKNNDLGHALHGIFRGGAAGSHVDDFVFVAVRVQFRLQPVGKGLAGLDTVTGGDAVAKAYKDRPVCGPNRTGQQKETE